MASLRNVLTARRAGYTVLFTAMLDHPLIDVELDIAFEDIRKRINYDRAVFTGPVDEYFGHCYGKLPYRSLEFRHETLEAEWLQSVAVVNYPSENGAYAHYRI